MNEECKIGPCTPWHHMICHGISSLAFAKTRVFRERQKGVERSNLQIHHRPIVVSHTTVRGTKLTRTAVRSIARKIPTTTTSVLGGDSPTVDLLTY